LGRGGGGGGVCGKDKEKDKEKGIEKGNQWREILKRTRVSMHKQMMMRQGKMTQEDKRKQHKMETMMRQGKMTQEDKRKQHKIFSAKHKTTQVKRKMLTTQDNTR
jgi:hypothetical protein